MSAKQLSRRFFILFLLVMLVTGCTASAVESPTATPEPTATPVVDFDEMVDLGDYAIQLMCSGEGSPTVILEHDRAVTMGSMMLIHIQVRNFARVCSHERATSPSHTESRSSQEYVDDLRALLVAAGVEGPFVLVGYQYGGMVMRLYAAQYPDEVAGLVLVDSRYEYQDDVFAENLPFEAADQLYRDSYPEDIQKSNEELAATGSLGDMPLCVLTAGQRPLRSQVSQYSDAAQELWLKMQEQLAGLSTNSTHIVVEDANPWSIVESDAVISAIRDVVDEVRAQDG